jgi:glycosyltransferase involved in cell wall biosynthesis
MKVFGGVTKSKPVRELIEAADQARDRKEWHDAAAAYRQVVQNDPALKHIWVQLGNCEKESGRLEAAESAYRTSIDIDRLVADTHLQLGHVLKLQGRLADAKDSYDTALALDPRSDAARAEIAALERLSVDSLAPRSAAARTEAGAPGELSTDSVLPKRISVVQPRLIFECGDLVEYFIENRVPTGIQRVQINIIQSGLTLGEFARRIRIIFYSRSDRNWHEIAALDFLSLVNAALQLRSVSDSAWQGIRTRICSGETAPRFEFAKHDTLVNIGTSWWIEDYFLRIRNLKDQFDLRYIPFVHDCIPLVTPEHCAENLTKEFAVWMEGVFRHADYFLVNSRATEADLVKFAAQFKQERPNVHVVQLDGNLTVLADRSEAEISDRKRLEPVFEQNDIAAKRTEEPKFVLFVSTLESRKNHILAFMVWDQLIAKLGLDNTPYLVCVGKYGWMFDHALAYLRGRPKLQRRVRILNGVDDRTLSALYNECEFSLYPSYYEGWGLPVTESLCHGKVPVIAKVSSLPEAGGSFALYFDPLATREAYGIIERLIVDKPYRSGLESKIKAGFRPRSWGDIAADLLSAANRATPKSPAVNGPASWNEQIEPGVFYDLAKSSEGEGRSRKSGVHLRIGEGWYPCEDWGVWTGKGDARLEFAFPDLNSRELVVYLRLKGAPGLGSSIEVASNFSDRVLAVSLGPNEVKWFNLVFPVSAKEIAVKELSFHTLALVDLATLTDGRDRRRIGCGVCAFGVAWRSDLEGRLAMMEAVAIASGHPV